MVAEDSILPASKTLALAQWKILLIFFSHQIDSYNYPHTQGAMPPAGMGLREPR